MLININKLELIKERFYMNIRLSKKTFVFIIVNVITVMTLSSENVFLALFNATVIWGDIILIPMMIVLLFNFFVEGESTEK
ncbi:hypothetical protein RN38_16840 [Hafnia paralvei]|uniref:Uncharacterized protein n=1 Tax=Hafnia paralvei TaxID=546367 RepID=A0A2A2MB27_9GAMM|nr:hypothetical protein RN38_16840 [Hafnia paralvei]PAV95915.1 hypothetical protein CJD50_12860 [Hafnia paralvei]